MKSIVIREIRLLNFKGIREMSIEFDPSETTLRGANGSGKTTVFDAFTWLLFGKDSSDRKDFNLKTLDGSGKAIEKIPHEVEATIIVGGDVVRLRKCFIEKWVKKRGTTTEEFDGHKTEQYVNDVPCSVSEYARKINELFVTEDIFKLITSPTYFLSQRKEFKRDMLFRMAGNVTDEDVAQMRPEFRELLDRLTGKTLDEYKREVAAKKKRIKSDMENIPARIDERKRDMPEAENWAQLETEIQARRKVIVELENAILDRSKAYNAITARRQDLARQLSDCETAKAVREGEIKVEVERGYHEQVAERNKLVTRLSTLQAERSRNETMRESVRERLQKHQAEREELLKEFYGLRDGQLPVFNDSEFVCPTCHRPFEASDIEAKKQEIRNNMISENKRRGLDVKKYIECETKEEKDYSDRIFAIDEEIAQIRANDLYINEPQKPAADLQLETDKEIIKWTNKITDLRNQLAEEVTAPDTSDLQEQKRETELAIRELESRLAKRDTIAATRKRIEELENSYKTMSDELTELEGAEFTIAAFGKAKIEQVESRINGLFRIVRWKMYDQQINGGEVETCDAMIDGVPYSDLNTAGKINAGLDIIRAIQRSESIAAPVFIDNRESVTEVEDMECQIINLVVDENYQQVSIV